jgi:hypothetical protein
VRKSHQEGAVHGRYQPGAVHDDSSYEAAFRVVQQAGDGQRETEKNSSKLKAVHGSAAKSGVYNSCKAHK